jgi:hypothetical protein
LDYLSLLRKCVSPKTGRRFGESTVFNYFSQDNGLPYCISDSGGGAQTRASRKKAIEIIVTSGFA